MQIGTMKAMRAREVLQRPLVNFWETALGMSRGFYLSLKARLKHVAAATMMCSHQVDREGEGKWNWENKRLADKVSKKAV